MDTPSSLLSLLSQRFNLQVSDPTTIAGLHDPTTVWKTLIWCMKKLVPGFAVVDGTPAATADDVVDGRVRDFLLQIDATLPPISPQAPLPVLWKTLELILQRANTTHEVQGEFKSRFELKINSKTGLVEETSGMRELIVVRGPILGMAWHPTERSLLAVFTKHNLHLIRDETSFERAGAFPNHVIGDIQAISWRPLSTPTARACLAVAGSNAVAVFDAANGGNESRWRIVDGGATSLSWNFSGRFLYLAASQTGLRVVDASLSTLKAVNSSTMRRRFNVNHHHINPTVVCSPCTGKVFMSGLWLKSFRILDEATHKHDSWLFDDVITSATWNVTGDVVIFATRTCAVVLLDVMKGQCRQIVSSSMLLPMELGGTLSGLTLSRSSKRFCVVMNENIVGMFALSHNLTARFIGCPISTFAHQSTAASFSVRGGNHDCTLAVAFLYGGGGESGERMAGVRFVPCELTA